MIIIGCDYHPGFQQIAFVDSDTGELSEARLGHKEEVEQFYRELSKRGVTVRVGMEASGHARWFERLLNELQFEVDWGRCRRTHETDREAKDRSARRAVVAAAKAGKSLSENLGTGRRESRSAPTAVASAPVGADAHAGHEPVARGGAQRGSKAQKSVVASGGAGGTARVIAGSLGEPAPAEPARPTRSAHAENPGTARKSRN